MCLVQYFRIYNKKRLYFEKVRKQNLFIED